MQMTAITCTSTGSSKQKTSHGKTRRTLKPTICSVPRGDLSVRPIQIKSLWLHEVSLTDVGKISQNNNVANLLVKQDPNGIKCQLQYSCENEEDATLRCGKGK